MAADWLGIICAGSLSFSKIDCISRYRALGYKTVPIAADDRHKADLGFDIVAWFFFRSDCGSYQWPATSRCTVMSGRSEAMKMFHVSIGVLLLLRVFCFCD